MMKKIIIISSVIIIVMALLVGGYFYRQSIIKEAYNTGFYQSQYYTAGVVLNDLQTKGYTVLTIDNQTIYLAPVSPERGDG